jgi:hypothetical protein
MVTLTTIAAEGYEFDYWSGALSGSENPTTILVDCAKEVTANFAPVTPVTVILTVNVSPTDGGTVTLEPSPPAEGYAVGTEVALTAVASEGYEFDHWSGALSGSENPTMIAMDSDKEVTANFAPVRPVTVILTVNVSPTDGGTVTLEPSPPAEGYAVGTEVTLTAIASEGYEFDHWSGALSSSENPTIITMDSEKEVIAHFIEVTSSPFPWWWIVVGVVVAGLLFYLLAMRRLWA